MAHYLANMMAADRGTEAAYEFDGDAALLDGDAGSVVDAFFGTLELAPIPKGELDYDVDAAFKRDTAAGMVVTAMGSLHLHGNDGPPMPFMVMISKK